MRRLMIDLRSDTVTKPTVEMRRAIAEADVDDDVIDVDPTVDRLQRLTAEILGKEAAIFMPSGTMTNQIAVRIHCKPGHELLCEEGCHIYHYEQGAFAQLSGIVARTLKGEGGVLCPEQFVGQIRPENEHLVRTRLVCLENTHNRGGGKIQPYETVERICAWAHEHGLRTHLDGARLFNAAVATGIDPPRWATHFDTVSVCFSKGLGAPVGSALAGSRELIDEALRHRKVLGGGMRQCGVTAAAALYALENHVERLALDHECARRLGAGIAEIDGLRLTPEQIDTNLLFFRVDERHGTAAQFCNKLRERGGLMLPLGPQSVRAVTHLDVTLEDADRAVEVLKEVCRKS